MRAALVALLLLAAGCVQPPADGMPGRGVALPTDPAEQARMLASLEALAGLDAAELTADRRDEMRRICGGLDVADLLGYLPAEVPWRVWCARTWGTTHGVQ